MVSISYTVEKSCLLLDFTFIFFCPNAAFPSVFSVYDSSVLLHVTARSLCERTITSFSLPLLTDCLAVVSDATVIVIACAT